MRSSTSRTSCGGCASIARREAPDRLASIILEASLEVRQAIVYATLIDVVVLLPIFFIGGLSGAFFQPLALSYGLAVLASMVVALTVTPALCLILLAKAPIEHRESPLVRWLQRDLRAGAGTPIIRRPRPVFAATGVVMVVGLAVVPLLGESLFPHFKERDFLMHWITKPGTSVEEERRIVTQVSRELRAIPGVRNFGSHIGQALLADEIAASISARTGSASIPRRTMTRPWPPSRKWSTAIPASSATSRPT